MLDTFKALADPCRLRLTAVLLAGEFTVQELTRIMGMGQSRISRHLKILTEAGVLTVKRQGTWSYYRVGEGNSFFAAIRPAFERETGARCPSGSGTWPPWRPCWRSAADAARSFSTVMPASGTIWPAPCCRCRSIGSACWSRCRMASRVLEIGIGTGGLLTELAARAARVIGVDHSPAMLEEARRRLAAAGTGGIELRLGEMTHLPLSDASVGCVVANMVLHHAADPPAVLAEIRRVLASGGVLLLADLARHEREAAREQLADQWLGFEEEELTGWLKTAGFAAVSIEHVAAGAGQETVLLVRGKTNGLNKLQKASQQKGE